MIIQKMLESRDRAGYVADWLAGLSDMFSSYTGKNVDAASAMTLSAWFNAVTTLADDVAKLPRHVFKRQGNGDRQQDTSHPAYQLLARQPNLRQTPFDLVRWMENKRVSWGNAYVYVETDFDGFPVALYPLPPEYVTLFVDGQGALWYVLSLPGLPDRKMPFEDVIHVKGPSDDGLSGNSYVGYAREALGVGLAQQEFEGKFYQTGMKLGGVLETPSKLGPDEKNKVRAEFEKMTAGLGNMHKVAVLDLGQKFTKLDMPLEDAQFVESKRLNIADVARFLKFPLYKLQEGKQAYNSNEQQNIEYLTGTLDPILVQYEQQFSLKLFSGREQKKYYVRVNRAALLRADLSARRSFLEGMIQNGIYTINEARAFEELNRYEPGAENPADRLLVSRNYVHLDDLQRTVTPAVAQTPRQEGAL